jgi:hypothetical protein
VKIRLSEKRRDRLPFYLLSGHACAVGFAGVPFPWAIAYILFWFGVSLWAQELVQIRRDQRDRLHRSLVALTRKCAEDQERAYFEDLVPKAVLAEVYPQESEVAR